MSQKIDLQQMTVTDLAWHCRQETDLYFARQEHDSSYCFELFRRAIQSNDEHALEMVIVQYQPLVTRWVERWISTHPDFLAFNEETQDFVAQAFERLWISFTPAKFDKSQNIAAVLRYLQMCAIGACVDALRKQRRIQIEHDAGDEEHELAESALTPEDLLQQDEIWQLVRRKAKDHKEYIVIYASFFLALSPREILAEYPNVFHDIKEIYQHKANFLERMARDDEMKGFIGG